MINGTKNIFYFSVVFSYPPSDNAEKKNALSNIFLFLWDREAIVDGKRLEVN